ncbi:SprT-like family protein [Muriicola jejuensis]|uniref:SprT domain-containing protein n=1 Tax=Muriicola jejuensis TaxID=504488 RepID=A0A6P0UBR7_9FLAO|nr:SprT-like domain-containing protein [Muriicola jejuensis]NER10467.1 sprT domain-containing protein [Muriicola jejuensis]SMP18605.1 SprT-like family protein [Muriicola jejuensis]
MNSVLERYLPESAVAPCFDLIRTHRVHLKVVNERMTRHGDYRLLPDGSHQITVNATPNPYRFLITLVHEIAHLIAFETYGRRIKPHGSEWKHTFQSLMLPFLRPEIFPSMLLPLLAKHFRNPKASSSTDSELAIALSKFDPPSDQSILMELPLGTVFRLKNGRTFKKGHRRVKRYQCVEIGSGRLYLFQPNAEVEVLN